MRLLETVSKLLESGPLCHHCLGRPFADLSHGLSNDDRGESLRITAALESDVPYEPETTPCWVCEDTCRDIEPWADRAVEAVEDIEFGTYQVGTRVPPLIEENDRLLREDVGLDPDAGEPLKSELNREIGKRLGKRTGTTVDFERPDIVVLLNLERGDVDVQINPAFVYGRYRKLERDVPQTEWPCTDCGASGIAFDPDEGEIDCPGCEGTGYRYPTSVEQEVRPHVVEAMKGEAGTFHGAGREDVDALMLGSGRPFVLEVERPKRRNPDCEALQARINEASDGTVEVNGLRLARYDMVERVKSLEASKEYEATVAFETAIGQAALEAACEELTGATIEQRTPDRVSHRRADKVRQRTVYRCQVRSHDGDTARIHIHGEGGLYVKELISGDDGRTEPNLASLLETGATVTALDVVSVEGEAEPFERDEFFVDSDSKALTES